jgi:putative membrane protein
MHALTASLLIAAALAYAIGVQRLWLRAGPGRAITYAHSASFYAGLAVLAIALLSPLHHQAERLLWAHMVQHELLMVIAAPLVVLGRPLEAWTWALPSAQRRFVRIPRVFSDVGVAWTVHAAAIWVWHVPGLFETALKVPWVHVAQHASFFGSAVLFWWSLLSPSHRRLAGVFSLFTTMLHTGALGALMTLARDSWYPGYELWDQQLAGLVMWVPAGLAYPIAALFIGSQWLRRAPA